MIDALGALAFDWLDEQVQKMPETDDPARYLVETAQIFRRLPIEHTVIFQIGFQSETRDRANPSDPTGAGPTIESAISSSLRSEWSTAAPYVEAGDWVEAWAIFSSQQRARVCSSSTWVWV